MSTWHRAKSATVNIRAVSESYTTQKFPKQVSQQHQLFFRRGFLESCFENFTYTTSPRTGAIYERTNLLFFWIKVWTFNRSPPGWMANGLDECRKKTSMICLEDPPQKHESDVVSVHCQETSLFIAGIFNSQLKCSFGCVPICWHTSPVFCESWRVAGYI